MSERLSSLSLRSQQHQQTWHNDTKFQQIANSFGAEMCQLRRKIEENGGEIKNIMSDYG